MNTASRLEKIDAKLDEKRRVELVLSVAKFRGPLRFVLNPLVHLSKSMTRRDIEILEKTRSNEIRWGRRLDAMDARFEEWWTGRMEKIVRMARDQKTQKQGNAVIGQVEMEVIPEAGIPETPVVKLDDMTANTIASALMNEELPDQI